MVSGHHGEEKMMKKISTVLLALMVATLSAKGQITIPVSIREYLGIKTGDDIDFVTTKSKTIELIPKYDNRGACWR